MIEYKSHTHSIPSLSGTSHANARTEQQCNN